MNINFFFIGLLFPYHNRAYLAQGSRKKTTIAYISISCVTVRVSPPWIVNIALFSTIFKDTSKLSYMPQNIQVKNKRKSLSENDAYYINNPWVTNILSELHGKLVKTGQMNTSYWAIQGIIHFSIYLLF